MMDMKRARTFWLKDLNGRDHLGNTGIDGRKILKWIISCNFIASLFTHHFLNPQISHADLQISAKVAINRIFYSSLPKSLHCLTHMYALVNLLKS
jgi:hypothetical protein